MVKYKIDCASKGGIFMLKPNLANIAQTLVFTTFLQLNATTVPTTTPSHPETATHQTTIYNSDNTNITPLVPELPANTLNTYLYFLENFQEKPSTEEVNSLLNKLQITQTTTPTTEEIYNALAKITSTTQANTPKFDGNINTLIKNIKNNTNQYLEEQPELVPALKNSEYKSLTYIYTIQQQVETIFEDCLEELLTTPSTYQTNELSERLTQLRFVIKFSRTEEYLNVMGYYDSNNNTLVILPDNINQKAQETSIPFETALKITLNNALNTILTSIYSQANNTAPTDPITYLSCTRLTPVNIKLAEQLDIALLLLLVAPDTHVSYEQLQKAILEKDIVTLYQLLGVTSITDLYQTNQVISAIAARNKESSLLNSFVILKNNQTQYDDKIQTLAGYIKRLLISTFKNSTISLEENIIAFNIAKCLIIQDCPETAEPTLKEQLTNLESFYIKFLSNYYNVPEEDIRKLETNSDSLKTYFAICDTLCEHDYGYDIPEEYYDKAIAIIEKIPLLKSILPQTSNRITPWDWEFFVEIKSQTNEENTPTTTTNVPTETTTSTSIIESAHIYTFQINNTLNEPLNSIKNKSINARPTVPTTPKRYTRTLQKS